MTHPRTLLRDTTLALLGLSVVSFGLGGEDMARGVLLGGGVTVVNLAVLAWLTSRLTRRLHEGQGAGLGGLVALKTLAVLLALGTLLTLTSPVGIAVGVTGAMSAFGLSGFRAAWRTAHEERIELALGLPQES